MEVVRKIDEADKYRVHYIGWRKTHDEVLDKMKIIKIDETPQNFDAKVIDVVKKIIPATVIKVSRNKSYLNEYKEDTDLILLLDNLRQEISQKEDSGFA
jgi:hypothetical protein